MRNKFPSRLKPPLYTRRLLRWHLRVLFQECDDIVSVLVLLQAGKVHFGALDVFLRLGQVVPEVIFSPRNSIIRIEVRMTDGR